MLQSEKSHRAFTLLELLVVIAIIAILAAILFPVFATARERARQTGCVSNARQLGIALMSYVQDHNESLAPSANYAAVPDASNRIWTQVLMPYVRSAGVFACPSASGRGLAADWANRGQQSIGYTTMTAVDPTRMEGFPDASTLPMIVETPRTPLFADTPSGPTPGRYRGFVFDPLNGPASAAFPAMGAPLTSDRDLVAANPNLPPSQLKPVIARHFATGQDAGLATVILADGHVRSYSAASILAREHGARLLWRFR